MAMVSGFVSLGSVDGCFGDQYLVEGWGIYGLYVLVLILYWFDVYMVGCEAKVGAARCGFFDGAERTTLC